MAVEEIFRVDFEDALSLSPESVMTGLSKGDILLLKAEGD